MSVVHRVPAIWNRGLADGWLPAGAAAVAVAVSLVYTVSDRSAGGDGFIWWECASIAAIATLAACGLPSRRPRPYLLAAAAVIAIVFTSRDSFSLWVAGAGLLFLSARASRPGAPWPALIACLAGFASVVGPDAAPLMPAVTGIVLIVVDRVWEKARLLQRWGEALEARAKASEAQAKWLEHRAELARELHDVVGHHVTAMVVQAEAGLAGFPAKQALEEIGSSGRIALGELDTLVLSIRDLGTPLPGSSTGLADIDDVLTAPLRHRGMNVDVVVDKDLAAPREVERAAFRIVQEALTNVMRHAQAENVTIRISRVGSTLNIRVTDDGVGLPAHVTRGSGLHGIEERVTLLGGTWKVASLDPRGTTVEAVVPVTGW